MYEISFAVGVVADLEKLPAGKRRRVLDEVKNKLSYQPTRPTKQIKHLRKLVPPFEAVPPIWQLRVGGYRVFYDVAEDGKEVFIRAVRRKPPHLSTEEIL